MPFSPSERPHHLDNSSAEYISSSLLGQCHTISEVANAIKNGLAEAARHHDLQKEITRDLLSATKKLEKMNILIPTESSADWIQHTENILDALTHSVEKILKQVTTITEDKQRREIALSTLSSITELLADLKERLDNSRPKKNNTIFASLELLNQIQSEVDEK